MAELKILGGKITTTNFGDIAEAKIKDLKDRPFKNDRGREEKITTSKIRGILELVNKIYNQVINSKEALLPDDVLSDIAYIKVKIAYESGREAVVKDFVERTDLMTVITDVMVEETRTSFLLFARYVESLVAYFKFYGGRDK